MGWSRPGLIASESGAAPRGRRASIGPWRRRGPGQSASAGGICRWAW